MMSLSDYARYLGILLWLCVVGTDVAAGGEMEARRIEIGLSLFPRVLAVDLKFPQKSSAAGVVDLVFVYRSDHEQAVACAAQLFRLHPLISSFKVRTSVVEVSQIDSQIDSNQGPPAAGYFLTEVLSVTDFEKVSRFGEKHSRIIFSPHSGDVERGAAIGIMITSQVQPYLNMATIERAGIQLNPLLLKLAKRYE